MSTLITVQPTFDYTEITDPLLAQEMQNRADEIIAKRRGIEADFLAIGTMLNETKDKLPHGQFMTWCAQACGIPQRTANRLMDVARTFGQSGRSGQFGITILEQLAAAPDPQAALEQAEKLEADGKPVTRDSAYAIAHGIPVPDTNPNPLTGTPAERILAAFATGSETKTTGLLCKLTGLNDLDLAHELTDLVEGGYLLRVGDSGKLFKRTVKVLRAADARVTDAEHDLTQMGMKITAWLREQTEPRGLLTLQSAIDPQTRIRDIVAALEHLIALGHIERVNKNYFRAITDEDRQARRDAELAERGDPFKHAVQAAVDLSNAVHAAAVAEAAAIETTPEPETPAPTPEPVPLMEQSDPEPEPAAPVAPDDDAARFFAGYGIQIDGPEDAAEPSASAATDEPAESPDATPGEALTSEPPAQPKGYLLPADIAEVRRLLHPGNNDLKTLFKKVSFDENRLSAVLRHLEMRGDVKLTNGTVTYAPKFMQTVEPPDDVKCFRYASQAQTPFVLGLFDILKAVGDERVRATRSVESWYALGGDELQTTRDRIAQVQREIAALNAHLTDLDAKLAEVQPRAVDVPAQHAVTA